MWSYSHYNNIQFSQYGVAISDVFRKIWIAQLWRINTTYEVMKEESSAGHGIAWACPAISAQPSYALYALILTYDARPPVGGVRLCAWCPAAYVIRATAGKRASEEHSPSLPNYHRPRFWVHVLQFRTVSLTANRCTCRQFRINRHDCVTRGLMLLYCYLGRNVSSRAAQ